MKSLPGPVCPVLYVDRQGFLSKGQNMPYETLGP